MSRKRWIWNEAYFVFRRHCHELGIPAPIEEFEFSKRRKFRFDYAWPCAKVAVECDGGGPRSRGGIGRHQDPKTRQVDLDKHNLATSLGWTVFHFTPQDLLNFKAAKAIRVRLLPPHYLDLDLEDYLFGYIPEFFPESRRSR